MGEMRLGILKGGRSHVDKANEQLMQYPFRAKLTETQITQLGERSLRVVGDLICVVDDELRWLDGRDLGIPWCERGISSLKSCLEQAAVGARASNRASEFTDHCELSSG